MSFFIMNLYPFKLNLAWRSPSLITSCFIAMFNPLFICLPLPPLLKTKRTAVYNWATTFLLNWEE